MLPFGARVRALPFGSCGADFWNGCAAAYGRLRNVVALGEAATLQDELKDFPRKVHGRRTSTNNARNGAHHEFVLVGAIAV